MQFVPNKTDLLGDLDPSLPVCKLGSSLLIMWGGENSNSDGVHFYSAYFVQGPVLQESHDVGPVIAPFLQMSMLKHRKVVSLA